MDKNDALEYLNQSRYFVGVEDYEEALKYINKAIDIDKMNIEFYIEKGIILANMDCYDEAIKELNNALKVNKKAAEVYFHLGNIYIMKENRGAGIENYNKAIAFGYDDAQIYYNLGLMYEEDDNDELAIRNYSKAIIKNPLRTDARVRKAKIYITNGKYPEALETLNQLILADPDLYDGYHLKSILLAEMKKLDEAMAVLEEGARLFPEDPAFPLDKINIYVLMGNKEKAIKEVEHIETTYSLENYQKRKLELEKSRLYAMDADIHAVTNALNKAREYTKLDDPSAIDAEATFLLVNCYLELKQFDKAVECSKELINSEELSYAIPSYYTLPYALAQDGKEDEAAAQYKESISKLRAITLKNPEILDGYFFRALCLKEIGDTEKALELSDYLIKINDKSKIFHSLKAEVLMAMGLETEARAEKELSESLA